MTLGVKCSEYLKNFYIPFNLILCDHVFVIRNTWLDTDPFPKSSVKLFSFSYVGVRFNCGMY